LPRWSAESQSRARAARRPSSSAALLSVGTCWRERAASPGLSSSRARSRSGRRAGTVGSAEPAPTLRPFAAPGPASRSTFRQRCPRRARDRAAGRWPTLLPSPSRSRGERAWRRPAAPLYAKQQCRPALLLVVPATVSPAWTEMPLACPSSRSDVRSCVSRTRLAVPVRGSASGTSSASARLYGPHRRRCAPTPARRRPPASSGSTACGQHRSRRTAPIPARWRYVPSGRTST
jgi:hypothetical protein